MVAAGLALLCQAAAAQAASFSVNPTLVQLSASVKSALLTLKNETDEPVRFQVSVFRWGQDPSGQIVTEPTDDIVFFPALLQLGPREERKIRVGTMVAPGPVEKSYRLFVEELPPLETAKLTNGVTMRTKMGIPIFLQSTALKTQAQLQDASMANDHVRFSVLNTGTVHFTPDSVRLRALDATGGTVGERAVEPWYILPGGRRDFDVAVSVQRCADVRSIVIDLQAVGRTFSETLQTPNGACAK
jgi:fimbrial chaperone protein